MSPVIPQPSTNHWKDLGVILTSNPKNIFLSPNTKLPAPLVLPRLWCFWPIALNQSQLGSQSPKQAVQATLDKEGANASKDTQGQIKQTNSVAKGTPVTSSLKLLSVAGRNSGQSPKLLSGLLPNAWASCCSKAREKDNRN